MENGWEKEMELLKGANLFLNQSLAMILKKYYYTIRNVKILIIQNLIPVLFLLLSVSKVCIFLQRDQIFF